MGLSDIDKNLLQRCLQRKPRAWENFVDRFMGLVVHVTIHTAGARSVRLSVEDRDDLCAEVFLRLIKDDFAVLRRFRGRCSLATYLTVVSRRIVVKEILARKPSTPLAEGALHGMEEKLYASHVSFEKRVEDAEEVESMLRSLQGTEAQIVRMYHLEGKNYYEISVAVGLSENSIGPMLSRAREKLRRLRTGPANSVPPIPNSLAR